MNVLNKASNILIYQTSVRDDMRNDEHNKTLGCFKDEFNSRGMSEMLGLNPKSHALKFQHIENNKKRSIKSSCQTNTYIKSL